MANQISLPLYERIHRKNTIPTAPLSAHLSSSFSKTPWRTWPPCLAMKTELPAVDMFVTTADAELEPPILTMNTVLSLLAADYPAHKLSCYLSDDGASPLTCYSLVETSEFAKIWVPFCKKYEISIRAPFQYFATCSKPSESDPFEYQEEWRTVKDKYEKLCRKIKDASETLAIMEEDEEGLPHLVYISREKRPKHPHHFKRGAMNVLTRVSGLMTNAPFILNVDCDMYVNNPQVILNAMCMLLGVNNEKECAFVQFPQYFYKGLKDDPFGNQFVVFVEENLRMRTCKESLENQISLMNQLRKFYQNPHVVKADFRTLSRLQHKLQVVVMNMVPALAQRCMNLLFSSLSQLS